VHGHRTELKIHELQIFKIYKDFTIGKISKF